METVCPLMDVLGLCRVASLLQLGNVLLHLGQFTVVHLCTHLPFLQRVVLGRTYGMADAVDGHLDSAWLTDHQQGLNSHTVVVVEQDLVHLHRVLREVELALGDLHGVHILRSLRTIEGYDEDTLALILLTVYHAFDVELSVVTLLTAVEHRHSCHSHKT